MIGALAAGKVLLASAGFGNSSALLANVGVGSINVLMTIVALRLLDRTGRRPLLLWGTAGMAVGMFATGFSFLTLVALGYFWRKVPETKRRSLQQIERDLTSAPAPAEAVMHP